MAIKTNEIGNEDKEEFLSTQTKGKELSNDTRSTILNIKIAEELSSPNTGFPSVYEVGKNSC